MNLILFIVEALVDDLVGVALENGEVLKAVTAVHQDVAVVDVVIIMILTIVSFGSTILRNVGVAIICTTASIRFVHAGIL